MTQTRSQPMDNPEALARTIVLRRLTASARTRAQLAQSLTDKGIPDEVADSVLDRFTELGLIDDADYAATFADSRRTRSGWSRRAIAAKLRERGVDRELIDQVMATVGPDDEFASALALGRRQWAQGSDDTRRRRLVAMLARRGYRHEIVSSVIAALEREESEVAE
jgi:regulatory protein